jgi:hypothetical protein
MLLSFFAATMSGCGGETSSTGHAAGGASGAGGVGGGAGGGSGTGGIAGAGGAFVCGPGAVSKCTRNCAIDDQCAAYAWKYGYDCNGTPGCLHLGGTHFCCAQ